MSDEIEALRGRVDSARRTLEAVQHIVDRDRARWVDGLPSHTGKTLTGILSAVTIQAFEAKKALDDAFMAEESRLDPPAQSFTKTEAEAWVARLDGDELVATKRLLALQTEFDSLRDPFAELKDGTLDHVSIEDAELIERRLSLLDELIEARREFDSLNHAYMKASDALDRLNGADPGDAER